MSTLTIRNLPPEVVERLKERARRNGRSMEQEARVILGHRLAPRDAVLDQVVARWETLPSRPSSAKVRRWGESARRRGDRGGAAPARTGRKSPARGGGKP